MSQARLFFVYVLIFANGKVYVGMSRTCKRGLTTTRFRAHTRDARVGRDLPIYRAWRKHGPPTQEIMSVHDSREACAEAEVLAIQTFGSMDPTKGYNLLPGGQGLHAPPGSRAHALMREKVWDNPEVRKKLSTALKGRALSPETQAAHAIWRQTPEAKAFIASVARRPEVRTAASARMTARLTPEFRAFLSEVQRGRPKNISAEGLAVGSAKRKAWAATPEGIEASRKGAAALRNNPEAMAKRRARHAEYLASDANAKLCKANAARASRPVRDERTGTEYASIRAAAAALNVTSPSIHYQIKKGRFVHV